MSESLDTRESKQSTLLLSFISTPVVQYSLLRKCYLPHSITKKIIIIKFISFHVASDWIGIEIPVACVPMMKYHSS